MQCVKDLMSANEAYHLFTCDSIQSSTIYIPAFAGPLVVEQLLPVFTTVCRGRDSNALTFCVTTSLYKPCLIAMFYAPFYKKDIKHIIFCFKNTCTASRTCRPHKFPTLK